MSLHPHQQLEPEEVLEHWAADRTSDPDLIDMRAVEPEPWDLCVEAVCFKLTVWYHTQAPTLPNWFSQAMAADDAGRMHRAIDLLYNNFDRLLSDGDFATVDHIINRTPVKDLTLTFLMGVLSITLPASSGGQLPSRKLLFDRTWERAVKSGRDAESLLGGLREWSGINGAGLRKQHEPCQ